MHEVPSFGSQLARIRNQYHRLSGSKLRVLGIALCALALLLSSCSTSQKKVSVPSARGKSLNSMLPVSIRRAGIITALSTIPAPPLIFSSGSGNTLEGIVPQLGKAMAQYLGVKIDFINSPFAGQEAALDAGRADMIFGTWEDTKAREKIMDFLDYMKAGNALLVPYGNPKRITGINSLCGMVVGEVQGASQNLLISAASKKCIQGGHSAIATLQYADGADARLALQSGRIAAFIGNAPVLPWVAGHSGGKDIFSAVGVESPGPGYDYSIVFRKGSATSAKLMSVIQKALHDVMESGKYKSILGKFDAANLAIAYPTIDAAAT